MAIFGRKKDEPPTPATANGASGANSSAKPATGPGSGEVPHEFSPEKARKFFGPARDVHEATNYEYAMTLWLNGLRFDPTNLEAVISFIRSCDAFCSVLPCAVSRVTRLQRLPTSNSASAGDVQSGPASRSI